MSLQLIFLDDFEDGQLDSTWKYIDTWYTGAFVEQNGVLSSDGSNTEWSALYIDKEYNGTIKEKVSVNVSSDSTNKGVIILIAKDNDYYYYLLFKYGIKQVELQRVPIGSTTPSEDVDAIATLTTFGAVIDDWQTLEVEYNPSDGTITITVDGTQVYSEQRTEVQGKTPFAGIGITKYVTLSYDDYELYAESTGGISISAGFSLVDSVSYNISGLISHSASFSLTDSVSYNTTTQISASASFSLTDNVDYVFTELGLSIIENAYVEESITITSSFSLVDSVSYNIAGLIEHSAGFSLVDSVSYNISGLISHSASFSLTDSVSYTVIPLITINSTFSLVDSVSYSSAGLVSHSASFSLIDNVGYNIAGLIEHSAGFSLIDNVSYNVTRVQVPSKTSNMWIIIIIVLILLLILLLRKR